MALEDNVKARKCCNLLMDLGIDLAKEESLPPEQIRRMWQYVMECAAELIGDTIVEPPAPKKQTKLFDEPSVMPFGKYEDYEFDEVPEHYWDWLADQDWVQSKWPSVYRYMKDEGYV